MLHRRAVFSLPAVLALGGRAWAQTREPDQAEQVARAAVQQTSDDGDLDAQIAKFKTESGFEKSVQQRKLFLLSGTAPVQVTASNPDWVRYRMIAYGNALIEAQADFVAEQTTVNLSKTTLEFYKSANEEPPAYVDAKTPGKAAELIRKLLAVSTGQLDKSLQDIGIDPRDYERAPEAQRSALLTNSLKTSTIQRSIGDTIGLCPVKTFEGNDGAGNYRIGVVAVASSAMRDFASRVLSARGAFDPEPQRAQDLAKLYSNPADLLKDFGVRRLFDEDGLPVVVSFGQWASAYRGTDAALAATYRDAARRQAEMLADSQISDFLKGSIDYQRSGTVGQEIDRIAESLPDTSSILDTKRVVDEIKRSIVRSSAIKITGLRTLSSWTARHPASPAQIVGTIRIWSAGGELAMRERVAPPVAAAGADSRPGTAKGPAGISQSRHLMDASDF